MMKRKQNAKRLILMLSLIMLLIISIGYAALSTELKINGNANIAMMSWNVYFTNLQTTTGSVEPTVAPTVSGTSTVSLNYSVTLENPGDFYEFTIDVKNGGTINAKIAEDGVVKTIKNGTAELTEAQAKLVTYTVAYADGSEIKAGDLLAKNGTANNADTKTIKVRLEFYPSATAEDLTAAGGDLNLNLSFGLNYEQE
jgi:hypothetical protein